MPSAYRELKERAWAANQEIPKRALAIYTFGNASALDAARGVVAIKPSGVAYDDLTVDDLVVVDLSGNVVEGALRPSSDTKTHLALYRAWKGVGGVVHTHSTATMAFGICGITPPHMTGQARAHLKEIQIVPYADAGSEKLRDFVVDVYKRAPDTRIVLLANHGLAASGPTLLEAYNRAEIVEDSAQAYLHCRLLGREPNLSF